MSLARWPVEPGQRAVRAQPVAGAADRDDVAVMQQSIGIAVAMSASSNTSPTRSPGGCRSPASSPAVSNGSRAGRTSAMDCKVTASPSRTGGTSTPVIARRLTSCACTSACACTARPRPRGARRARGRGRFARQPAPTIACTLRPQASEATASVAHAPVPTDFALRRDVPPAAPATHSGTPSSISRFCAPSSQWKRSACAERLAASSPGVRQSGRSMLASASSWRTSRVEASRLRNQACSIAPASDCARAPGDQATSESVSSRFVAAIRGNRMARCWPRAADNGLTAVLHLRNHAPNPCSRLHNWLQSGNRT